jgi:HD-GYP domain-containing protein (c-di-GMP phosphodiesterase class II)
MSQQRKGLIQEFIKTFIPAVTRAHQYNTFHQQTIHAINIAYNNLLKAIGKDQVLPFMIIDGRIVIYEEPLEDSPYIDRFIRLFKGIGIQHVHIMQDISLDELTSFVDLLITRPMPTQDLPSFPHIQFGKIELTNDPEEKEEDGQTSERFKNIHAKDLDLSSDIYTAVKTGRKLPVSDIQQVVREVLLAIRHESSMLVAFSPLRILDEYTYTHSTNVSILNIAQGMALGMNDDLIHEVGVAGLLHDMGKLFVPEEILNKPGKLTDTEWEMIRSHPLKGAEYLLENPGITPLAVVVAYEHHMQYDNSGYPRVSKDWRQNMCSHMTAISDFFDAMRTKRIYRDSLETKIIADRMVKASGTAFNPMLTKNFLVLIEQMTQDLRF